MTLVPSSANPKTSETSILTHSISISKDGQAFWRGASQTCDGVKTVAAELNVGPPPPLFVMMSDCIDLSGTHSDPAAPQSCFPSQ